jgi:putative membrane protein
MRLTPPDRAWLPRLRFALRWLPLVLLALVAAPAWAGPGDGAADSVYLIGEFVDPVCIFQHGMQGALQKKCALVRGRVEQGMFFLDIRRRRLYAVIGQTHWEDPRAGFLASLGDTFAVSGRVWNREGSSAIAISAVHPYRDQPQPAYRWWPWHWEWSVLLGCALLAALYGLALHRLRPRLAALSDSHLGWRITSFAGALLIVLVSLNGPLHDLSDLYLFSTHMVQHLFLAQIFPLLLLLGLPPELTRRLLAPRWARTVWGWLAGVPAGFILYTVVFSVWHVPALYNLMMRDHDFHIAMHLMVMGTAVLMWWPILGGDAVAKPLPPAAQMLYLFLLGTPMMAVAAPITFANHPLYEWYALAPRFMGFSALEDQRLGGLLMWVPGGLFYWAVMSVVFFRWSAQESRPDEPLAAQPLRS